MTHQPDILDIYENYRKDKIIITAIRQDRCDGLYENGKTFNDMAIDEIIDYWEYLGKAKNSIASIFKGNRYEKNDNRCKPLMAFDEKYGI